MESTARSERSYKEAQDSFSIGEYLQKCMKHWLWFALSIAIFLVLAVLYTMCYEPKYERHTDILIEDQDMGGGADIGSAFASLGLVSSNTNVNNELISFTSPYIMFEVVKRLNLNTTYVWKKFPHDVTLYKASQPFIASFPALGENDNITLDISYDTNSSILIKQIKLQRDGQDKPTKYEVDLSIKPGQTHVNSPAGKICIIPNPEYTGKPLEQMDIQVSRSGLAATAESYSKRLKGDLINEKADVISLSMDGTNVLLLDDILNTIMLVYNENWIQSKNRTAIASSAFIDERLKVIEQELGVVDDDISSFKSKHLTPDLEMSAEAFVRQNSEMDNELIKVNNEFAMTQYIFEWLKNPSNQNQVIPMNSGIGNQQVEQQISTYNNLLLARDNMASNSSAANPIVQQYDSQLKGMREAIVKAVIAQRSSLSAALNNLQSAKGQNQSQLAAAPSQAKYLISVERQQKIKEELYLFLLQKREENELNQAFTAYNTRVITPPTGPISPIAPKKKLIILLALILGAGIPAVIVYLLMNTDNTIHSRKDLDHISVPFAGEIPITHKESFLKRALKTKSQRKKEIETPRFVVKEGDRGVVNEAFRVVRSNLNMMFGKENKCPVMLLTSFNPGSGKSFISFNLATAFELKGKRVLLIDTDLRHGSSSNFAGKPAHGLSDYLLDHTDDWQKFVVKADVSDSPDVLPIGKMPPNPAELLENGRMGRLIAQARDSYDLIILDCPPVNIVVDTQIVEQYADQTVFVVRAGLLKKEALVEIEDLYKSKMFKKMCILLNGTDPQYSRYQIYGSYQNLEADRG